MSSWVWGVGVANLWKGPLYPSLFSGWETQLIGDPVESRVMCIGVFQKHDLCLSPMRYNRQALSSHFTGEYQRGCVTGPPSNSQLKAERCFGVSPEQRQQTLKKVWREWHGLRSTRDWGGLASPIWRPEILLGRVSHWVLMKFPEGGGAWDS